MMNIEWNVLLGLAIVIQMRLADLTTSPINTQCGNITCSGYAKCRSVTDGSGGYECICFAGYTGETCSEDIDECAYGDSALCLNRGYCSNTIGSFRCECLTGWEGPEHCETPNSPAEDRKCVPGHMGEWCLDTCLNNSMCGPNQECMQRGRGLRCICIRGWYGSNCTEDIDECVSNPCNHSDMCRNTPGSYYCESIPATATPDVRITYCNSSNCGSNGKCFDDQYGKRICQCFQGFQGDTCYEDVDECFNGDRICFFRGFCHNTYGSWWCECLTGWEGLHCETPTAPPENRTCVPGHIGELCLDTCLNDSMCGHNQVCKLRGGRELRCTCIGGWRGLNCTEDIDECVSNPCNHSDMCINTPGSYYCESRSATVIPDVNKTYCDVLNCSRNSECLDDGHGNKFCRCFVGFLGANCYEDVDECSFGDKACLFRGSCHNTYGSWWCDCLQGWQNTGQCETPISPPENRTCIKGYMGEWCMDQCLSNDMCGFHQECKMQDLGMRCICKNGWLGVNCSQDLDECFSNPCASNEICVNTPGSYQCTGDSTSAGISLNNSLCDTINCSKNSACVDDFDGGKICHCFAGFKGVHCNDDIDECSFGNKICYNRGVCHNTYGSWWCDCLQGWNGTYCQNPMEHPENRRCVKGHFGDWCLDTCFNNSMCAKNEECVQEGQGLSCKCIPGFHGMNCSEGNDECSNHPCMNNGTCFNTLGSYHCACPQGWQDAICSSDIDECASIPCMNGGTCFNEPGSYHCACGSGWRGATCEYDVDECIINPCQHNGTCYNKMGSFICTCDHGWWGETCTYESYECLGPTCILG